MTALTIIQSLRTSDLPSSERWLLACIALRAAEAGGECSVANAVLCEDSGLSESSVRRLTRALADRGALAVVDRPGRTQLIQVMGCYHERG